MNRQMSKDNLKYKYVLENSPNPRSLVGASALDSREKKAVRSLK